MVRRLSDAVDHVLRFARDPIDDVIDADRLRDVLNKEDQPCDAGQSEQHCAGNCGNRSKGVREEVRGRHCGHAIGEGAEEDTQRPLSHAVPDEANEDSGGELHRRERQRHKKNGENDRNDRHDRPGDRAEDDLGDLGVGTGRKQHPGNPGAQHWDGFFERRKDSTEKAESDGDQQRPDQKAAAQRIHRGAEQGN
jgi:hypothetical protein